MRFLNASSWETDILPLLVLARRGCSTGENWVVPTVSSLWPTRTEPSWKLPRHGKSDHLMYFKERVFDTFHFCDLYRSCAGTEIISEAPFFDFLIF